jgi:isocitrate dehydrogenase
MSESTQIAVAYGDGIGPEIMEATLYVLKEAKAKIAVSSIEIGEKLYVKHFTSGINEAAWETISRSAVLLKSPITTPQGGGYKSLNVTLRKALGLYANVRPTSSFHPFITTKHPKMDLVIIRENEEDIYAGIEYRHTHNVYESMKLISKTGSEKIIRYAFEYARKNGRKKVTCFSKDNIMKFSDGIFHKVFDAVAAEYKDIEANNLLMDIGTAKLANKPELFDVIVTSNLYGDIISDVAAEISGSVGLAGSSNIGPDYAMFEAVHGSAPDIAGRGIANPSGLINAAVMMLVHINQPKPAMLIENALKKTIEDGVHTGDIYKEGVSSKKVSTMEFAKELVARLGQEPSNLPKANYSEVKHDSKAFVPVIDVSEPKTLVGVDIFIDAIIANSGELADKIKQLDLGEIELKTISTKGLKVWPDHSNAPILADHWCCRFMSRGSVMTHHQTAKLLNLLADQGIDFIKVEHLYNFGDSRGYSLAQGE